MNFSSHKPMPARQGSLGQPLKRREDASLLRGEGRYTDDLDLPGQAYAVMVRSPVAHGVIRAIDISAAREMPGVLAVYTGADLAARGYGGLMPGVAVPNHDGTPMHALPRLAMPLDKVRFGGEALAFVVAETASAARDAAEAVLCEIDALPAVTSIREALGDDAPQLHAGVSGNVAVDYRFGDKAAVDAAFRQAAHVTRLNLENSRVVTNPMEPRSALAAYDPLEGRWTLKVGGQGAFGMRTALIRDVLRIAPEKLRVLIGNVGGSFGMKSQPYPEYICVLHAARELSRPVKWTGDRSESFLSDHHGRAHEMLAELALDAEGRFLAVRLTGYGNIGAHPVSIVPFTENAAKNIGSVYRTPLVEVASKGVFTNTTPVGSYRGAGRPEGNYYMERLIDGAAAELGIDRLELRRRNHISAEAMPYRVASGQIYDSGDFGGLMEKAVKLADWEGFEARRRASLADGKLRGIGLGSYLEVTAGKTPEMGGIRFEADGSVTMITGTLDYGQGHATPFAQVLNAKLGIPLDRIALLQGDSDELLVGGGTAGSRSLTASGAALSAAAEEVIAKGRQIAGHLLEAAAVDIEFSEGRFAIAGTDRAIGLLEVAQALRSGVVLPPELPQSLDARLAIDGPPSTFPNGCHVVEVEIDPDTGIVDIVNYTAVSDFGVVVNPMIVEGQLHGGIAQGIGQTLMERTVYNEDGQLLTGSYMDYALPRAEHFPLAFRSGQSPTPATTNALGVKGCGEAGCAGSLPSIMNAVVDALSPLGIRHFDMPATPERIWQAIRTAKR